MDLGDLAGRWLAKQIKQKARTSHTSPRQQTATIRSLMSRSPGLPPVCPGGGPLSDRPYKAEVGGSKPPAPPPHAEGRGCGAAQARLLRSLGGTPETGKPSAGWPRPRVP